MKEHAIATKGQNVGYIRVSTADQNTARQLDGIHLDEKFEDTTSGKDTTRPKLEACIKHCRKGDTLHVHSIDRLARNLADLQRLVKEQKWPRKFVQAFRWELC